MALTIRKPEDVKWDLVALGEVMLRLDPGDVRIRNARQFRVWEGGGEYNVARGLRKAFHLRTSIVTAAVDNDIGYLLEDLMLQGGVDLSHLKWVPFDGIGRASRIGLNFTEAGFGVRAALGVSDRAHSAASQLKKGDVDWDQIFGSEGARWFHTGGIFAALSATTPDVVEEAMKAAKKHGTIVSYDLNYRPSLWKSVGGHAKAIEVNRRLAPLVDVMIGNEEDFTAALGFEVPGADEHLSKIEIDSFRRMIEKVVTEFPNFQCVATTMRKASTASVNDWGALLYSEGKLFESKSYPGLEIHDRVGGGDSFASGMIFGLLSGKDAQIAVDYGAAHGALAMTTPGDTSMVSQKEVEKLMSSSTARVER